MTGMNRTGCCGTRPNACVYCDPEVRVCCLELVSSGNTYRPTLIARNTQFYQGDVCNSDQFGIATNLCGEAFSLAFFDTNGDRDEPLRPTWDTTSHKCLPIYRAQWGVNTTCDSVNFALGATWAPDYSYNHKWLNVSLPRDWYTGSFEIEDPLYYLLPLERRPEVVPIFTVSVCDAEFDEFPVRDEPVYLRATRELYNNTLERWEVNKDAAVGFGRGNCVCSNSQGCKPIYNSDRHTAFVRWVYRSYSDTVLISVDGMGSGGWGDLEVEYNACFWPDQTYYVTARPESGTTYNGVRYRIDRVSECTELDPNPPPSDPELYCYARRLCVLLSVDEGATYSYYRLDWNGDENKYILAESVAPLGKPYTIEITLVEDPTSMPVDADPGTRAWVLHVIVRETTGGTVALDYTEVYVLTCEEKWSRTSELAVESPPAADWFLKIATNCPDPPDPPPCDPGCWPECVLCPDPLSMSIVVSENTVCCFNGTFALTHDSGANRYYLPAPVGYTAGVCGGIRTFVMTCDSETSVTFTWKYRDEDGNDHDRTDVVSAACSGGSFETAAVEILSNFFTPGICNRGIGKGANVRVVGV